MYGAIMVPMPPFVTPQKWRHKFTMAPQNGANHGAIGDILWRQWRHFLAPYDTLFMSVIKVWRLMAPQTVCGVIKWSIAQIVAPTAAVLENLSCVKFWSMAPILERSMPMAPLWRHYGGILVPFWRHCVAIVVPLWRRFVDPFCGAIVAPLV